MARNDEVVDRWVKDNGSRQVLYSNGWSLEREREKERELLAAGFIMYVLNFHFLILIIYILFFFFTRGDVTP